MSDPRRAELQAEVERLTDRLAKAEAVVVEARAALPALKASYIAAVTVKPDLETPFQDDPRWSPWTRFMEPAARKASAAKAQLTCALAAYDAATRSDGEGA